MSTRKRVAFALDGLWWRLWWVQSVACFFLGHEPIPSASWLQLDLKASNKG